MIEEENIQARQDDSISNIISGRLPDSSPLDDLMLPADAPEHNIKINRKDSSNKYFMKNNPKAVNILTAASGSNPTEETEQLAEAVNDQKDNAMKFPDEMTIF